MTRSADETLRVALFHFEAAHEYTNLDMTSQAIVDGIAMRIAAGIDCLNRLDEGQASRLFDAWDDMRGMRNRIVHGYFTLDTAIVKKAAMHELPEVIATITAQLS